MKASQSSRFGTRSEMAEAARRQRAQAEPARHERPSVPESAKRQAHEHAQAQAQARAQAAVPAHASNQRSARYADERAHARRRQAPQGQPGRQGRMSAAQLSAASEYSASRYVARKRGMSRGKKVALGIVIALVVILAAGCIGFAMWYGNISNNIKGDKDISNLTAPVADAPYYVLLMGSDSREGWEPVDDYNNGERSDSIMVARIDEKAQSVCIISVPRDLRVKVPGHGYQKINSTIEYGGYNLLVSTLNEMFDIKINYYAIVYFQGFLDLVDTLGGVTVEVPEGTADYNMDETEPDIILPYGDAVLLNGEQALVLARCRHGWPIDQGAYAMGDYQRTLNQRNLIKAIAKEVLAQDVTKLPGLIESLSKCVETNMSVDRIISIALNMKGMDVESMQSAQLPIGAATINGAWEAVMYQDVFEVMDGNFVNGRPLFEHLDNFNPEFNDDNVGTDYTDGKLYAYTKYSTLHGSPYSDGYTPPSSSSSSGTSGSSKSSSSSGSSSDD